MNDFIKIILPGLGIILLIVIVWALATGWLKKALARILHRMYKGQGDFSKCPRCDGTLLLEISNNERFLRCNNYPKCKYSVNNTQ